MTEVRARRRPRLSPQVAYGHLGTAFDAQAIFGAGRSETLQWLLENGYAEEHANLSEWLSQWEDPMIEDWARHVRAYFYSPDGALLLEPI